MDSLGEVSGKLDIFSRIEPENVRFAATLAGVTANYKRGQFFAQNETTGKYEAVADLTAFNAITTQVGVLSKDIALTGTDKQAVLIARGSFIQDMVIPDDIPVGAYFNGSIFIEKEIY